jgi:hypothetical protein
VIRVPDLGRRLRRGDDSGSIPLVLVLSIVGVGLSLLLATTVQIQQRTTRFDVRRAHALNAAQTGIDVGVSKIRAAIKSGGSGDLAKLPPCGTFTGSVNPDGSAPYEVTIYYLSEKPQSGDVDGAAAGSMCMPGAKPTTVPRYALIKSIGKSQPGAVGRTLVATYVFSTTTINPNIPGGQISAYRETSTVKLCLSADRDRLTGGEPVIVATCVNPPTGRQKFAYEGNLNLVLVSSRTPSNPRGMCVDAGSRPAHQSSVTFRPCAATTTPSQQWGLNDYSAFQGTTDGINLNNFCLNVRDPGTNLSPVVLGNQSNDQNACEKGFSENKTFFTDPAVGTGKAGRATKQLVNYSQFSRCIDVAENNPKTKFLVVFPCKQQPTGTVTWNQVWNLPEIAPGDSSVDGPIHTATAGVSYCLTNVGPTQYPELSVCSPGSVTDQSMIWTYRVDSGTYSSSYRIESTYGASPGNPYCLTPTDLGGSKKDVWTVFGGSADFSKVALARCDDSAMQKWNASPTIVKSALMDVVER